MSGIYYNDTKSTNTYYAPHAEGSSDEFFLLQIRTEMMSVVCRGINQL